MPPTAQLTELYGPIVLPLETVGEAVASLWRDTFQLANAELESASGAGGKLLRPALCLLSAGACGAMDLDHFVPLAAAVEVLHLAALAHDDVVDGADVRRGARSLKALWTNHAAVLGGDYLVARAMDMMAEYRSLELLQDTIYAVRQMAEGELALFGRDPDTYAREDCIQLAERKTGSLFALACATPCRLIQGGPVEALSQYGLAIGIAFQLADDLLDLLQDEATLGKPSCGDIAEGKPTLPILFMSKALDRDGLARLAALRGARLKAEDRAWVARMLESTGARHRTEAVAREYILQAQRALAPVDAGPLKDSLMALADYSLVRQA